VFSKWSLPFRFSNQNFTCISHHSNAWYVPAPLILLDLITLIIFGEAFKLQISSLCSLLQPHTTTFLLDPNVLRSTLFSSTFNPYPAVIMRGKVSHCYKTTGKIIILCVLNF
jgi:hypothetical protein